jgi:hypothetical protein
MQQLNWRSKCIKWAFWRQQVTCAGQHLEAWVEFWHCNLTFMWHLLFERKLVFRFRDEETL